MVLSVGEGGEWSGRVGSGVDKRRSPITDLLQGWFFIQRCHLFLSHWTPCSDEAAVGGREGSEDEGRRGISHHQTRPQDGQHRHERDTQGAGENRDRTEEERERGQSMSVCVVVQV